MKFLYLLFSSVVCYTKRSLHLRSLFIILIIGLATLSLIAQQPPPVKKDSVKRDTVPPLKRDTIPPLTNILPAPDTIPLPTDTLPPVNDTIPPILPAPDTLQFPSDTIPSATTPVQGELIIKGVVKDEQGGTMPGVGVIEKGTTNGVATDVNGAFTLSIANSASVLSVSLIGYEQQEIPVGDKTEFNIQLRSEATTMQEVVIIGYQSVQRRDLTGATSVISPEDATRVSAASLAESIQGLAPGVTVRNSGAPGQNPRIEIRGAASFTNTNPLYVIDGMIADANQTINNNDIESVQILKDASASAIYGSRAANGVIIMTTKKGREGDPEFNFSAKYGVQQIPKRYDLMNTEEFAAMQRTQYQNSGLTPPASVDAAFNPSIDTDWQEEAMQNGNIQDYNLSVSGGSKTSTYYLSGSYFTNKGTIIGHDFQRGSFRINTSSTRGRVTIGENLVITNSSSLNPAEGNPYRDEPNPFVNVTQLLPIIPVSDPQYISAINPEGWGIGTSGAVTYAANPVAVNNLSTGKINYTKAVGNAYIDVKITDWLHYKFNAGLEVSFDHIEQVRKVGIWQFSASSYPSSINEERATFLSSLLEHTLNFDKKLGKHSLNGVIGYTQQNTSREFTAGGRTNLQFFNNDYMTSIGSALGESNADGGITTDYRIYGYLGRVNYTYDDRYLLTLTGRIDQDSRFGSNNRTGFFPAAAAAWRISKEEFFNAPWVNDLKLNASYGILGISNLGSWDYGAYVNNGPRAILGSGQNPNVGITQAQLANPDLKWEEREVKNIGIDGRFFNNRIMLFVAAYNSLTTDALLRLPVAGYLGNLGGNPFVNAGSIRNSGFELELAYSSNAKEFKWEIGGNLTTIKNKVESVGNQGEGIDYLSASNTRTQVGRSMGEWYLLKTDGLFQSQEEVNAYVNSAGTVIQPYAKPGDVRFVDKDDDGDIDADDRDFAGTPWPKLQMGARFNASYKQFSLNIQLVGVFGNKVYNDVRRFMDSYQNTNFRSDINPWAEDNTDTSDPRIGIADDQGIISNNRIESDRWLENGSYLRLRNIELAYQLPAQLLTRMRLSNARVYVSGQNLFTITSYSGYDPDITGGGLLERGLDIGNWPSSRVLSAGIQFGF